MTFPLPNPVAGCFVTWGLDNGTWTCAELAAKLKAKSYAWAALMMDGHGNAPRWPRGFRPRHG